MADPLEGLHRWGERIRDAGGRLPLPEAVIARADVPRDGIFRQWDTEGRLWVYVNRDELADAIEASVDWHHMKIESGVGTRPPSFGIPVRFE